MKAKGVLVVSLDFELLYGISHLDNQPYWESTVLGGRKAIPQILALFEKYGIHATWAAVGMLMAKDKEEMIRFSPACRPRYEKNNYDWDRIGENEAQCPLRFGGSLVELVRNTAHQEIGTHTFSHFYCMFSGQDAGDFEADIDAAVKIGSEKGLKPESIVFPKNQVEEAYLPVLRRAGITAYRGTERSYLYRPEGKQRVFKRVARFADAYINLSGHNCYAPDRLEIKEGLVNVPSSRLLRPYNRKLKLLEGLKLGRIKGQMRYAAKHGKLFHLWWHPHNFGLDTAENLRNLESVLKYYRVLQEKYGMESRTIAEAAEMRRAL